MTDPLIGARVGDYVIEARVAAGGMGVVYRATHPLLKRRVAVKVLLPEAAQDEAQAARFLQEAQTLAGIQHKGIVQIENFGQLPDGRQFMAMEYLEGETLEGLLRRMGPIPADKLFPMMEEVLDALGAAHAAGVVHRDLKPSNVFLVEHAASSHYLKLVDFGLAKLGPLMRAQAAAGARASIVAGTPHYISPEQAQGLVATPQSDLYCFGGMLFELLTGRLPFPGRSWAELISAQLNVQAPRLSSLLPGVPPVLDDLVAELLEKDPALRPPSAEAVRLRLRAVGEALKLAPMTQPRGPARVTQAAPTRFSERYGVRPRTFAAGMVALVVLGGGATVAVMALREPDAPPAVPVVHKPGPPVVAQPVAPVEPPQPAPAVDPDLERKLREAAAREELTDRERGNVKHTFVLMSKQGFKKGNEADDAHTITNAWKTEIEDQRAADRNVEEHASATERARAEVMQAREQLEAEKQCHGDWQKTARHRLRDIEQQKGARLSAKNKAAVKEQLEKLTDDARDMALLIKSATDLKSCMAVFRALESWASAP